MQGNENQTTKPGGLSPLSGGLAGLDRFTSNLPKSAMILVAARPFMGKTALALQMARQLFLHRNKPVAYFTPGIAKEQIVQRMLSAEIEINLEKIISGQLTHDELCKLSASAEQISEALFYIFDETVHSIDKIHEKLYQLKKHSGLEAVFIDYLKLMPGRRNLNSRKQEFVEITKELKEVAEELQLPVILLSQLSRALEKRTDRRPVLNDLLEYGEIESSADMIMFIYRDSYYNKMPDMEDIAEVIVAKNSYGSTGKIDLIYSEQYQKYIDTPEA